LSCRVKFRRLYLTVENSLPDFTEMVEELEGLG
jgi:hypothetical protein